MPRSGEFAIEISPRGAGYTPAYFDDSYPFFGNKDQMAAMVNVDLTDPNVITQGPSPAILTAGSQAGAVTTLIRSILDIAVTSNVSYAIGGSKLHQLSATAVSNAGIWPHSIDKAAVTGEDGEDVCYYKSKLYYFYNHSGSAGDIGQYDLSATFDDDWGSTVPTGAAALQNAPHQAINGGDDVMYFTNGIYVGTYNGTTLDPTALDFATNSQVASIAWNLDRVLCAVNRPNISGANANQSAVYKWNGVDSSWDTDPVIINGVIGALWTKLGVVYIWWQENGTSNRYNFGYLTDSRPVALATYSGTLPLYYQVGESRGFISWTSGGAQYMWGATDPKALVRTFQYFSASYTTSGGLASPFGSLIVASSDGGSNFKLEQPSSSYSIVSSWKSIAFQMSQAGTKAAIDSIHVSTDQLASGAKCDFTLYYDKLKSSLALAQIAYSATVNTTMHKILSKSVLVEDFQLWPNFANGSATNPVKIRSILIKGHFVPNS